MPKNTKWMHKISTDQILKLILKFRRYFFRIVDSTATKQISLIPLWSDWCVPNRKWHSWINFDGRFMSCDIWVSFIFYNRNVICVSNACVVFVKSGILKCQLVTLSR
jgi:hypothetical protein